MPDAVTALGGARLEGIVSAAEAPLAGMVTLRGDLADQDIAAAVEAATGVGVPGPLRAVGDAGAAALWMSPDELLLLTSYGAAAEVVARLEAALVEVHHLAVDVSDARAQFTLAGAGLRDVLAKLTPADMSPAAFGPGSIRRTRLGQVAAAIWMQADGRVQVFCSRSVARYMWDLLTVAARPGGEVGYFAPLAPTR